MRRILRRVHWRGIGDDTHHAFSRLFFVAKDIDIVAIAFTHFLAINAGHGFCRSLDARFRQPEDPPVRLGLSECFVHFHGEIAGHFDVLFLVFTDRHGIALVNQNIRRHKNRIAE